MSRKFIAAVLAAALTVTGLTAGQARATEPQDIVKFLGAAATILVIGNAIQKSRDKDDDRRVYVQPEKVHDDRYRYDRDDRGWHDNRGRKHDWNRGREHDWNRGRQALPAACLMRGTPRWGREVSVLGAACVENTYRGARRLPEQCRTQMRTNYGVRTVYETRCLSRNGYEVARR